MRKTIEIDFTEQIKTLKSAKPPMPSPKETHEEFMKRCVNEGLSEKECMEAHKGHEFKEK